MNAESSSGEVPEIKPNQEGVDADKEEVTSAGTEDGAERRLFRRYRFSMPIWLSYGHNFREVESGLVRDISKAGIFLVTQGGRGIKVGDTVKVNATFTVRGEARVVRVAEDDEGALGIGLELVRKLELDI